MKNPDLYAQLELITPGEYASVPPTLPVDSKTHLAQAKRRLSQVGRSLLQYLCGSTEPRITRKFDAEGIPYFAVYDPVSNEHCTFSSEPELRTWLEQRYYS